MLNFIMMTLSVTLGILLSYVVVLYLLAQPKVLKYYLTYTLRCIEENLAELKCEDEIKEDKEDKES